MTTLKNGGDDVRPPKSNNSKQGAADKRSGADPLGALYSRLGDPGLGKGYAALSDFATAEEGVAKAQAEATGRVYAELAGKAETETERDKRQAGFEDELRRQRQEQWRRGERRKILFNNLTASCGALALAFLGAAVFRGR
ncbi:hypothetical protein [Stenotrophomonas maltophilia group sp. CASM26]|uniref:hypothetical protein n=1 Tax=Stenotrophomonas maltophilia group sp. CASM26 TaxID=3111514 RepID=UPI003BF8FE71